MNPENKVINLQSVFWEDGRSHLEAVNRSFELQADEYESKTLQFSREEYLQYMVQTIRPKQTDELLEVAAGTCICGRSFASLVYSVVCLDTTESMLEVGKREAKRLKLRNMTFVKGFAEELPFPDECFDIVFSRLAFHHFMNVERAFSEIARCLKSGGKLVLIDMEAVEEKLRPVQDEIERLRDPSHVRNLNRNEMRGIFSGHGLNIETCETSIIQQRLSSWVALCWVWCRRNLRMSAAAVWMRIF